MKVVSGRIAYTFRAVMATALSAAVLASWREPSLDHHRRAGAPNLHAIWPDVFPKATASTRHSYGSRTTIA
jgi:ABC-type phosphate/phosphonate transport system permease subunit